MELTWLYTLLKAIREFFGLLRDFIGDPKTSLSKISTSINLRGVIYLLIGLLFVIILLIPYKFAIPKLVYTLISVLFAVIVLIIFSSVGKKDYLSDYNDKIIEYFRSSNDTKEEFLESLLVIMKFLSDGFGETERLSVMLVEHDQAMGDKDLTVISQAGIYEELVGHEFSSKESMAGFVLRSKKSILARNVDTHSEICKKYKNSLADRGNSIKGYLGIPVFPPNSSKKFVIQFVSPEENIIPETKEVNHFTKFTYQEWASKHNEIK